MLEYPLHGTSSVRGLASVMLLPLAMLVGLSGMAARILYPDLLPASGVSQGEVLPATCLCDHGDRVPHGGEGVSSLQNHLSWKWHVSLRGISVGSAPT